MNEVFDPLTIIILVAAIFVFWRLRSVLGTRTGHEQQFDPFSKETETPSPRTKERDEGDNVIALPGSQKPSPSPDRSANDLRDEWRRFAQEDSDLWKGFEKVAEHDHEFSPKDFVEGAKVAYEMIVTAFAEGDKSTLSSLLSKDVFEGFDAAIDSREASGHQMKMQFVGLDSAEIQDANVKMKKAQVTVRFVSEMISATLDEKGVVVDGDPMHVQEVIDVWTFERDLTSRDPNWLLVATEDIA